ncbi:uncharacterized protein [Phyllobates terribilis]|uniref:uncharacterized protein n=1 Tax=Phyllobates terribilis TaxID=111132 RepID=UPI003CCB0425
MAPMFNNPQTNPIMTSVPGDFSNSSYRLMVYVRLKLAPAGHESDEEGPVEGSCVQARPREKRKGTGHRRLRLWGTEGPAAKSGGQETAGLLAPPDARRLSSIIGPSTTKWERHLQKAQAACHTERRNSADILSKLAQKKLKRNAELPRRVWKSITHPTLLDRYFGKGANVLNFFSRRRHHPRPSAPGLLLACDVEGTRWGDEPTAQHLVGHGPSGEGQGGPQQEDLPAALAATPSQGTKDRSAQTQDLQFKRTATSSFFPAQYRSGRERNQICVFSISCQFLS